jgi:hypothetical protein
MLGDRQVKNPYKVDGLEIEVEEGNILKSRVENDVFFILEEYSANPNSGYHTFYQLSRPALETVQIIVPLSKLSRISAVYCKSLAEN